MADTATIINHWQEIYNLLSDGLKIGLGALISGVITYKITKLNHKHELIKEKNLYLQDLEKHDALHNRTLEKEKFNRKITMLTEATGLVEQYFRCTYILWIDGMDWQIKI